jgi:hypothetical protein
MKENKGEKDKIERNMLRKSRKRYKRGYPCHIK